MAWTQHADTLLGGCSIVTIPVSDGEEVGGIKDNINGIMEPSLPSINLQFVCSCFQSSSYSLKNHKVKDYNPFSFSSEGAYRISVWLYFHYMFARVVVQCVEHVWAGMYDVTVLTPCPEAEEAIHRDREEEEASQDHKHRSLC